MENINPEVQKVADSIGAKIIPFHSIETVCVQALENRKYTLLLDKKGQCESYFQYKGQLKKLHAEHMKCSMMNTPKTDVCESLRKSLAAAQNNGATYVISCGAIPVSMSSNFKSGDAEKYRYYDVMTWDTEKIFDFELWRNPASYMNFVTEDEKVTKSGAEYVMQEAFQLVILANYTNEKQMKELVEEGLPKCRDNFEIYIVIDA